MVNVLAAPSQTTPLLECGVTVIVPLIGAEVPLVPAKAAMFPVPLAPNPIDVLLLAHVNEVAVPLKVTAVVLPPVHTTWLPTVLTVGVGLTVIVKLVGVPSQVTPPFV